MDYNKILEQIKEKTLRRMAMQDPKDYMHENWETVDGKYTDRMTEFNGWDWTRSFLSGVIALLYKEYGDEKFKTIGKMLDENVTLEGLFTIVLKTVVSDGKYQFSTKNNGQDTVKTPMGLFDDALIENDLAAVDAAIREYYGI